MQKNYRNIEVSYLDKDQDITNEENNKINQDHNSRC